MAVNTFLLLYFKCSNMSLYDREHHNILHFVADFLLYLGVKSSVFASLYKTLNQVKASLCGALSEQTVASERGLNFSRLTV